MKHYACIGCGLSLEEKELVIITNLNWVMKPTDDECCPYCNNLGIEVSDE